MVVAVKVCQIVLLIFACLTHITYAINIILWIESLCGRHKITVVGQQILVYSEEIFSIYALISVGVFAWNSLELRQLLYVIGKTCAAGNVAGIVIVIIKRASIYLSRCHVNWDESNRVAITRQVVVKEP